VSQIVLTYVVSKSQLEEYANRVLEGDDGFPDDEFEFSAGFDCEAKAMIGLGTMLQDQVSVSAPKFECVERLREHEIPLLLAFHVWDKTSIVAALEGLESDPLRLGRFYEELFSESWDGAGAAMLEACRFVRAGVERLDETHCWFLLFVS
jgi:hypothetical protein